MATNDFLPFGTAVGANVMSQTDYAALTARATGFQSGTAASAQLNKAWRQSSIMASMLAQFIVDQSGQSAIDDGTIATLEANLLTAIRAAGRQATILADTGTANAYAASNTPALTALPASGYSQRINIANANTGAATYAPDGLANRPIYGLALQPLQGGEIPVGMVVLMYLVQAGVNSGNGAWILIDSLGGAPQVPNSSRSLHAVNAGQIQTQSLTAFTSGGVSAALTLTPVPAITAYAANQRFRVKFGLASTGSDTLNISGLGAKSLKQYSGTGSKVPAIFSTSQLADVEYDGTDLVVLNPLSPSQATESVVGVAAIATQTATNAGTDDTVIVTPKKLRWGFSISLNVNGYVAFPSWLGSFVVQWGQGTSSGTAAENVSISMPLAWPTGSFVEVATVVGSNTGNYTVTRGTMTISTMKFTALLNGSFASGITIRWIAIGY